MGKIMNKKIIIISVVGFVVVAAAGAGIWMAVGGDDEGRRKFKPVDLSDKSSEDIIEKMQSDEFRNMERSERRNYARSAMREVMTRRVNEYHKLPKEERVAYLDNVIDEMQERRAEFEKMREQRTQERQQSRETSDKNGQGGREGRRGGGRRDPSRMRSRMERVDSDTRAKMTNFMMDMRARMEERGIESPFRGGGR